MLLREHAPMKKLLNDTTVGVRLPMVILDRLEADAYAHRLKGAAPLLRLMALERYGLLPPGAKVPAPGNNSRQQSDASPARIASPSGRAAGQELAREPNGPEAA